MRLALLLSLLTLYPLSTLAQKCELTLEQSPELRGFKLGMTVVQARAKLSGVTFPKPNENGELTLFLSGPILRRADTSASNDVSSGLLTFFDGRLVSVSIGYKDSVEWESADELVFSVSQSLGLPPVWPRRSRANGSDYLEGYVEERDLWCPGFVVSAKLNKIRRPPVVINLIDASYPERLTERIREVKERKKARFKP